MKIYFVHSRHYEHLLKEQNCKIIVSYGRKHCYEGGNPNIPNGYPEVIIDSGGYQMQSGTEDREVLLGGYGMWLQLLLPQHPEIKGYFNLDVWKREDLTKKNQQYLESLGLKPIPIWHSGTDISHLDYYCEQSEVVAIGGVARAKNKEEIAILTTWLFQRHPTQKFHYLGIGLSGIKAFNHFRPYSVDFSTWSAPIRYGVELVDDKKQFLRESTRSEQDRQRLRDDKNYAEQEVRTTITKIKSLEDRVEEMKGPLQGVLL